MKGKSGHKPDGKTCGGWAEMKRDEAGPLLGILAEALVLGGRSPTPEGMLALVRSLPRDEEEGAQRFDDGRKAEGKPQPPDPEWVARLEAVIGREKGIPGRQAVMDRLAEAFTALRRKQPRTLEAIELVLEGMVEAARHAERVGAAWAREDAEARKPGSTKKAALARRARSAA